jgi:hypothetical protein
MLVTLEDFELGFHNDLIMTVPNTGDIRHTLSAAVDGTPIEVLGAGYWGTDFGSIEGRC